MHKRWNDANGTYRLKDPRGTERHLDTARSDNIVQDGYGLVSRTPRVHGIDRCMSPERAKEIDDMHRSFRMDDDDY